MAKNSMEITIQKIAPAHDVAGSNNAKSYIVHLPLRSLYRTSLLHIIYAFRVHQSRNLHKPLPFYFELILFEMNFHICIYSYFNIFPASCLWDRCTPSYLLRHHRQLHMMVNILSWYTLFSHISHSLHWTQEIILYRMNVYIDTKTIRKYILTCGKPFPNLRHSHHLNSVKNKRFGRTNNYHDY